MDQAVSCCGLALDMLPFSSMFQRLSRGGHTRSHSEHGSQAPHRRWYLAHGSGRVGRRWIHAPLEGNLKGGLSFLHLPRGLCATAPPAPGKNTYVAWLRCATASRRTGVRPRHPDGHARGSAPWRRRPALPAVRRRMSFPCIAVNLFPQQDTGQGPCPSRPWKNTYVGRSRGPRIACLGHGTDTVPQEISLRSRCTLRIPWFVFCISYVRRSGLER